MDDEKDVTEYTLEDWMDINRRLEKVGMPKLIIDNGKVYKDDLHHLLGIGLEIVK